MQQVTFLNIETPRLGKLPLREQPTQRIFSYGAKAVSMTELLASIIGGSKQLETATWLVAKYKTFAALSRAPLVELQSIPGLGKALAARLKAALELGRRLLIESPDPMPQITSPADAANLVLHEMSVLEKEEVRVALLNTRNRVLDISTVYVGSLNTNFVRVCELFRSAIRQNAAAIIVIHNHPSGDPTPSPEDVRLTEMVVQAGKLLDIDVMDHLIIGQGLFVSLKERGLGFGPGRSISL